MQMCVFASDENGLRAGEVLPGPAASPHRQLSKQKSHHNGAEITVRKRV